MPTEYDLESGVDLLAIDEPTKVQLVQAFNKLRPLSHIGGIIISSGANNQHPDVTSNPRYKRYIWIDNQVRTAPVIKTYAPETDGDDTYDAWVNSLLANDSVLSDNIAQFAVSLLTYAGESRISLKQDVTPDISKANYLVRVDSAGQYVEIVSAATVVNGVTINLAQLNNAGALDGYVLSFDAAANVAKWAALSISTAIGANSIALNKLVNAAAANYSWLVRANPTTGIMELVSNSDKDTNAVGDLLAIRSVRLNRLDATAAVNHDKLRFDGTNWVKTSPLYAAPTTGGTTLPDRLTGGVLSVAHGLGAVPRRFGGFIVNTNTEYGYAVGDVVPLECVIQTGNGGEIKPGVTLAANAINVYASFLLDGGAGAGQGYRVSRLDTNVLSGILTAASWNVFLWAEL